MIKFRSLLIIALCLLVGQSVCHAAGKDIRLKLSSGEEARISRSEDGSWAYRCGKEEAYDLEMDNAGSLVFKKNRRILASGRFKGEKITLTAETGGWFLSLKVKPGKIKVFPDTSSSPFEFKVKPGKVKVVYGGVDYGKVKYYPDTGKLKAKDSMGNTVAEMRGLYTLNAAPGAFLVESFSRDQSVFMALFLLSAGN